MAMINEFVSHIPFFGIFLTGAAYVAALKLQAKLKWSFLNPLVVSCVIIIPMLLAMGIDPDVFINGSVREDGSFDGTGARFFQLMLTPTTICLAVPLYEKLSYLKKYPLAIFAGITSGAITSIGTVLATAVIFDLTHEEYVTLLPKSITTAVGMGVSEAQGGIVPVTVAVIVLTGVFGNIIAGFVMKLFRIKHPVAIGLACGTAAHAIGTSKAREFGEVEEAMSGLSIAVCGVITVVFASFASMLR